jgi:hypothetical protein
LATYGGICRIFGDESPLIAKQVFTDGKVLSAEKENLSVDLEKTGRFVMKFGYLHNKIIVFGKKICK